MNTIIDSKRVNAALFLTLADEHAAYIITSDLYTKNFVNALSYARHMVKGGSYSGGESAVVYAQLKKLERHFA